MGRANEHILGAKLANAKYKAQHTSTAFNCLHAEEDRGGGMGTAHEQILSARVPMGCVAQSRVPS